MRLATLLAGPALVAVGVEAQSASSTSSAGPATHTVTVGMVEHAFSPNNVTAAVGDTVVFEFYPGNHSVVRANYEFPCIPYEMSGPSLSGFFSGYRNPPKIVPDSMPTFAVKVNSTEPMFFYCSAPGSCKHWHMVGVINQNATQTLERQLELANKAGVIQLAPGEDWPTESDPDQVPPGYTGTVPGRSGGNSDSSSTLGAGAIAGIAIGGFAALVLAGAIIFICGRKSRGKYAEAPAAPPAAPAGQDIKTQYAGAGGAVDNKFAPNSPGQSIFTTSDTYRQSVAPSHTPVSYGPPHGAHPYPPSSASPPPGSPGYSPYPTYQSVGQTMPPHAAGPQMAEIMPSYHTVGNQPPAQQPVAELAASPDPGNSPLPSYQPRQPSFYADSEAAYRPSPK